MTTPFKYWVLNSSTNRRTPALAMTTSSAAGCGSTLRLYLKPEQPPGRTATRNPTVSGAAFSSAKNLRTSSPARSVRVSVTVGFCVVLITILLSGRNLGGGGGAVNGLPPLATAGRVPPIGGPMQLTFADWLIIGLYFAFNIAIGFYYKARAGKSTAEFFLSGRNVPWWLAGTSMVATTFAADTLLVVTGFVARNGIAGNWLWWGVVASGMLTVFFYSRLWRRAGVMTPVVFAVRAVGGVESMKTKLIAGGRSDVLNFIPDMNSAWMPMITYLVYISLNSWATWYPGAEPGGGGYVAQRMFSAKDERHSLLATLWFNIAHYAIRPWPWILVAMASLILYPGLADPETGYIRVMIDHLPPALRGLMVAAFAAAYMSTIATQLNWGASYLVNDFWRRFVRRDGTDE